MKHKLLIFIFIFWLLSLVPAMAQYIATQKGDKVEVRDIRGKYLTSANYSGLREIAQGREIIVLWYQSGKVEVRTFMLKYIASQYYSNINKISAAEENVVLFYKNGKVEVRDKNLKYISSRFQ